MTQSVCKCDHPPAVHDRLGCAMIGCTCRHHEPVAEPASTGEPPPFKSDNPWHLFHHLWTKAVGSAEYVKQEWRDLEAVLVRAKGAARSSEPSACNWPFEGCCTQKEACIQANRCLKNLPPAPQTSADLRKCTCPTTQWTGSEPNDSTCELTEEEHAQLDNAAAPQPVSGDAPTCKFICADGSVCVEPKDAHKFGLHMHKFVETSPFISAGNVTKVEELARRIVRKFADKYGNVGVSHQDIDMVSAILRPFPTASQTPENVQMACLEIASKMSSDVTLIQRDAEWIAKVLRKHVATPASTARTDGWVSVPHDLLMELRGVLVGEWNFAPPESDKAKYLHTLWTQIDAIRFPAAPGSVPQAEPPK